MPKITALPGASTLDGTEVIPVVQAGTTKKAAASQFVTKDAAGNVALPNGALIVGATTIPGGAAQLTAVTSDMGSAFIAHAPSGNIRLRPYIDATTGAIIDSSNADQTGYAPLTLVGAGVRIASKGGALAVTCDINGNVLAGVTSGTCHQFDGDPASAGDPIFKLSQQTGTTVPVAAYKVDSNGVEAANAANAAFKVGKSATGRSIAVSGTVDVLGMDYAEHEQNGGLRIAKGDIIGFDSTGTLTLTFADAVRFGVKSTSPGFVGGDGWADGVGQRPEAPRFAPPLYTGPAKPVEPQVPVKPVDEQAEQGGDVDDVIARYLRAQAALKLTQYTRAHAKYQIAHDAYIADLAVYDTAKAEHAAAVSAAQIEFDYITYPAYETELAAFTARLEAARQLVDRIAYCGKVPVNVIGAVPGEYIIAVADKDGGITGQCVADPTFKQYKLAVGRVNRVLPDGRAEIAVMVH